MIPKLSFIGLIEKLCHHKPSNRYKVDQALQHPWITRNFEDPIPRTLFEESIYQTEIDTKLRKVLTVISLYLLSIVLPQHLVSLNSH